jgi:hypothetical protein
VFFKYFPIVDRDEHTRFITFIIGNVMQVHIFGFSLILLKQQSYSFLWFISNELPRGRVPRYQMKFLISNPEGRGINPLLLVRRAPAPKLQHRRSAQA